MNVVFDKAFYKSIQKLNQPQIKNRVARIIEQAEAAKTIQDIPNIKKLEGFKSFYRIRIGEYRIGMELGAGNTLRFIIVANRKDIYKLFP